MEDKALLSTEVASGAEKAELLIVIPAYNEAENIERVVNHLTANFCSMIMWSSMTDRAMRRRRSAREMDIIC